MAYATNTSEVNFGTLTAGSDVEVTHYSLLFNYGAEGELVLFTGSFGTARTFVANDDLILEAGSLDINLVTTRLTDASAKAMIDALVAAKTNLTMSLGTANMGSGGKTNEIPGNRGYARKVVALTTGLGSAPA